MALPAGILYSHKTSSAQILAGVGKLWGWSIKATATNAEATLWDALTATTTTIGILGAAVDNNVAEMFFSKPLDISTGLYLTLTNCVGSVFYEVR